MSSERPTGPQEPAAAALADWLDWSVPLLEAAAAVQLLILDVDGVLTTGGIAVGADGGEQQTFHVRDGLGVRLLIEAGIDVAVVSGRGGPALSARMERLGIQRVFQQQKDKAAAYAELKTALDLADAAIAFVGDDLIDLPILARCGLPVAVADAHPALHEHVRYRCRLPGGRGAVREVCDLILHARFGYPRVLAQFLPESPR